MSTVCTDHGSFEEKLRKAPSWLISVTVHAIILLVLVQIGFVSSAGKLPPIVSALLAEPPIKIDNPVVIETPDLPINKDNMPDKPEEPDDPLKDDFLVEAPFTDVLGDPEDPNLDDSFERPLPIIAWKTNGPPKGFGDVIKRRRGVLDGPPGPTGGGPPGTDPRKPIEPALMWLARVQEEDGHWDSRKWGAVDNFDVGCTGLALCVFLAMGHSDKEGPYARNITMALHWLNQQQRANGDIGNFGCSRFYGQGIATMACCDAYGMSGTPWVKRLGQKGVDFIVATQPDDGGFDYTGSRGPHNDTSITGWQIMALKTARLVGMDVPDTAFEKANRYLRESINPDGSTGYRKTEGPNGAMTSVGLLCRLVLDWGKQHPDCQRAARYIHQTKVDTNDLYYCYYSAFAFKVMGGTAWTMWRKDLFDPIAKRQLPGKTGLGGSWNPDTRWGKSAGRVYSTAMSCLVLATDFRYTMIARE